MAKQGLFASLNLHNLDCDVNRLKTLASLADTAKKQADVAMVDKRGNVAHKLQRASRLYSDAIEATWECMQLLHVQHPATLVRVGNKQDDDDNGTLEQAVPIFQFMLRVYGNRALSYMKRSRFHRSAGQSQRSYTFRALRDTQMVCVLAMYAGGHSDPSQWPSGAVLPHKTHLGGKDFTVFAKALIRGAQLCCTLGNPLTGAELLKSVVPYENPQTHSMDEEIAKAWPDIKQSIQKGEFKMEHDSSVHVGKFPISWSRITHTQQNMIPNGVDMCLAMRDDTIFAWGGDPKEKGNPRVVYVLPSVESGLRAGGNAQWHRVPLRGDVPSRVSKLAVLDPDNANWYLLSQGKGRSLSVYRVILRDWAEGLQCQLLAEEVGDDSDPDVHADDLPPGHPVGPPLAWEASSACLVHKTILFFGGLQQRRSVRRMNDVTMTYHIPSGAWMLHTDTVNPLPRYGATMWADPASRSVYMFGGLHFVGVDSYTLNDLWRFNAKVGAWNRIVPSGLVPCSRGAAAVGVDSERRVAFLLGGTRLDDVSLGPDYDVRDPMMYSFSMDDHVFRLVTPALKGTMTAQGHHLLVSHRANNSSRVFVCNPQFQLNSADVTSAEDKPQQCAQCGVSAMVHKLKGCGKCWGVMYCSIVCQEAHFEKHSPVCTPHPPLED